MEFIHEYDSTSHSSGESSNENNEELYQNQSRSVYLVTYSQANKEEIPKRAFFAQALVKSLNTSVLKLYSGVVGRKITKKEVRTTTRLWNSKCSRTG